MNGLLGNFMNLLYVDLIFDSTILKPLFWMVMGALMVLFFTGIRLWFQDIKITMTWWKWVLFATWFFGVYVVISGGFTLIGENETRAGLYFMGVFGTLFIVFGAGLWRILKKN